MPAKGILIGSARAVKSASASVQGLADKRITFDGAFLIGEGAVPLDIVGRAHTWDALDFTPFAGAEFVLAEPLAPNALRSLLARAADADVALCVWEKERVRRVALEDLFDSPLRKVDWTRIGGAIAGKRVLITGGGGSIGSQLARRVAALSPERLTILDSSELNLYNIALDLRDATLALADIRDTERVRHWIGRQKPDVVFHAAALKQVPLVEMFPSEGVLTNVLGVKNVVDAAHDNGADVIFLSTDKAVAPSGVMGATKRLGELYCQALDRRGGKRAIPVRLGNVLGSAGSVAPVFEAQLEAGGPLTVTDPNVTRFFMSIPQAAKALLQACATGLSAEHLRGAAFIIDMGEALPVVDFARDMIRLSGQRPDKDVQITFTGLRPGEKLHERLIDDDEWSQPSPVPGVIAAASTPRDIAEVSGAMDRLIELARAGNDEAIVKQLFEAIAGDPVERERAVAG